jgi:hypothetical protein
MVLDEERAVIAERLGLHIAFDEFPEARATVVVRATPLCLCTAEESKLHSLLPFLVLHLSLMYERRHSALVLETLLSQSPAPLPVGGDMPQVPYTPRALRTGHEIAVFGELA